MHIDLRECPCSASRFAPPDPARARCVCAQSLDQERRVFAVDMRNHGSSSHHDSMTYVDMADDVLGFLADKVGCFLFYACAFSTGRVGVFLV